MSPCSWTSPGWWSSGSLLLRRRWTASSVVTMLLWNTAQDPVRWAPQPQSHCTCSSAAAAAAFPKELPRRTQSDRHLQHVLSHILKSRNQTQLLWKIFKGLVIVYVIFSFQFLFKWCIDRLTMNRDSVIQQNQDKFFKEVNYFGHLISVLVPCRAVCIKWEFATFFALKLF